MKVSELSSLIIEKKLSSAGLGIKIGPFSIKLKSSIPDIAEHIENFYAEYPLSEDCFFDFHISLKKVGGLRRWVKPQVLFFHDEYSPFKPLPYDQAPAMFEWGLNWCIASMAHHFFIIHAAVVEKDGKAIILPGMPGAGKSTLCSALCLSGWRLLSDEMTLLDPKTFEITPVPRPVSLKNQSIELIRTFFSDAYIGRKAEDTAKGTVAHLRPLSSSIDNANVKAIPHVVVFPKYKEGCPVHLTMQKKTTALIDIQKNAFNTNVLGHTGFVTAHDLIRRLNIYSLSYSQLNDVMPVFDDLLLTAE